MEPNRFFFKLTAILLQYLLIILIIIPFVYLSQLIKYNFNTEEIMMLKVLFLAIALAMPVVVANAFAFAKFERIELAYYLKSTQKHTVLLPQSSETILANVIRNTSDLPFWTLVDQSSEELTFKVKHLLIKDNVILHTNPKGENSTEVIIRSAPSSSLAFLDFGRNYKNILQLLTATKS